MVLKQVISLPPKKGHRDRNDECEKGESTHDFWAHNLETHPKFKSL